jgi:hypothetical protein
MENVEKLERIVRQFPNQTVEFYMKKLGWKRAKTYDYLQTLRNQQKILEKNPLIDGAMAYWSYRATQNRFWKAIVDYHGLKKKGLG